MDDLRKLEKLEEMLSHDMELTHGDETYVFKLSSFDVIGKVVRVVYKYIGETPLGNQLVHYFEQRHAAYLEKIMKTYFILNYRAQTIFVIGSPQSGIY